MNVDRMLNVIMSQCFKMLIFLVVMCRLNVYLADSTSTTSTESTSSAGTPNVFDMDHLNEYPNCGVLDTFQNVNTGRVVNAVDAREQYRWVVLIEKHTHNTITNLKNQEICTGSIITDRYELMSGHINNQQSKSRNV